MLPRNVSMPGRHRRAEYAALLSEERARSADVPSRRSPHHLAVGADHALGQDDVAVEPALRRWRRWRSMASRGRRRRSARACAIFSGKPARRSTIVWKSATAGGISSGLPTTCMQCAGLSTKESSGSTERIASSAWLASAPSSRTSRLALLQGRVVGVDDGDLVAMAHGAQDHQELGRQQRVDAAQHAISWVSAERRAGRFAARRRGRRGRSLGQIDRGSRPGRPAAMSKLLSIFTTACSSAEPAGDDRLVAGQLAGEDACRGAGRPPARRSPRPRGESRGRRRRAAAGRRSGTLPSGGAERAVGDLRPAPCSSAASR